MTEALIITQEDPFVTQMTSIKRKVKELNGSVPTPEAVLALKPKGALHPLIQYVFNASEDPKKPFDYAAFKARLVNIETIYKKVAPILNRYETITGEESPERELITNDELTGIELLAKDKGFDVNGTHIPLSTPENKALHDAMLHFNTNVNKSNVVEITFLDANENVILALTGQKAPSKKAASQGAKKAGGF